MNLTILVLLAGMSILGIATTVSAQQNPVPSNPPTVPMPDFKTEVLWDGRKIMPFKTQDNPKMIAASAAGDFLDDSEYILGITVNGESRAYPTRFIWFHHAVNDNVGKADKGGKIPVGVTYCSVCNTGLCFDERLDNTTALLDFYGLYNGVVALCDRKTESVLTQMNGHFETGTLKGKIYNQFPALDTTWGNWKMLHPDTLVMAPEAQNAKFYAPKGVAEQRGYTKFPVPYFEPTVTRKDPRLPQFEKVLAVILFVNDKKKSANEKTTLRRAYPIRMLDFAGGVLNDEIGGEPIVVWLESDTVTANALSRRIENRTLTFELHSRDGKRAFIDRETGSRWNIEGLAVEGTLKGKSLVRIENHLSQWYGWAAFYPDTEVFGLTMVTEPTTKPPKP